MSEIYTRKGQVILLDECDAILLGRLTWHITSDGYVARNAPCGGGKYRTEMMHRVILGLEYGDPREGDHENGNRSDNRRHNLRICTEAENAKNKGRYVNNLSGFKGVHKVGHYERWRARIRVDGVLVNLGYFDSPDAAYAAYCEAAARFHGAFANFGGGNGTAL
ncbi:TPA: HNH endonuclease [Burkholderia vietnamiensis]|nr:HNH endonuclease [Burkholderia vietnamiensis]